jgi:hypothetical protein
MMDAKPFLSQTAETASFAFREFFRPLVAVTRFWKLRRASSEIAGPHPENQASLEEAQTLLRERLARGRHHEKILLLQVVLSSLASLLALVISLMHAFDVQIAVVLFILLPVSTFAVWATFRFIHKREEIVELKTLRWVMKSVDRETAERVAKQVLWGKPERKRRSKKNGKPL